MLATVNDSIRRAFKERMKELGITQEELGKALGAPQSSISRILTGKIGKIPSLIERMADKLDLEVTAVRKTTQDS